MVSDSILTFLYNFRNSVIKRLDLIIANQKAALLQEREDMSVLDDDLATITADMNSQATVVDSLKPFIQGLFDQIAKSVPSLTAEQTAALAMIKTAVEASNAKIAAAMVSTPPTPPTPPAP